MRPAPEGTVVLMRMTKHLLVTIALIGALALGACGNDANDSSASFCDAAASYQATVPSVAQSPAELEATLAQQQHAVDELKSAAPSEIIADVDTVATFTGVQERALAAVGYDYSKMANDPAGRAAIESLASPEFHDALRNLNNYITVQCHTTTAEPGPVPAEMCPQGAWPAAAAYELETGNFEWVTCTSEGRLFVPAAASEDTVWVANTFGGQREYRAFDAVSGKELWRGDETRFDSEVPADADRPVTARRLVIDGVQLTGGQDDPMVGIDEATRDTLWTQPGHLVYDDVWAVGDGAVFAMETGDSSGKPPALVGYDVATGDVRWRRGTTFMSPWPWHVSGERLLAMWFSLQVLATDDGSVLWEIGYPEPPTGLPHLMGGLTNSQSVFVTFASDASGGD